MFKYIHLSALIPDERKAFYSSLVRAQLSQNELYALLFNSLVDGYGDPKFIFLIKRYNILKNFNTDGIPDPIIWEYYLDKVVVDPYDHPIG
ncbi:putative phage abortive infection protein [Pedobacter sp. GSP4]|uniref:putative phage abortive infection protein n=1 Tax=Pedobacter sp. GSP4 TaxID=3453716 RepID=UPI003EEFFB1F